MMNQTMPLTWNRLSLAAGLLTATLWPGAALAANITGTITFDGKPPALRPLARNARRFILCSTARQSNQKYFQCGCGAS